MTPGYLGYSGDFKAEHLTSDGFFKTGDLGYYDSNDYFYFVGRSKDIIKYNSFVEKLLIILIEIMY